MTVEGQQEDTQQTPNENRQQAQRVDPNEPPRKGGSLSLVLSGLAVLLAALALVANQMGHRPPPPRIDPMAALMNSKLGQIEARISDVESQMHSDKVESANLQLQHILLDLRHLSAIADDTTRAKIDRAYRLLQPLSEPETRVKAQVDMQSTEAPENQSQPEASTPAEPAAPAPAPDKPAASPGATPGTDNTAPAESPAPKAGNGATDQGAPADKSNGSPPPQQAAPTQS